MLQITRGGSQPSRRDRQNDAYRIQEALNGKTVDWMERSATNNTANDHARPSQTVATSQSILTRA